jgi:hypothetical protein
VSRCLPSGEHLFDLGDGAVREFLIRCEHQGRFHASVHGFPNLAEGQRTPHGEPVTGACLGNLTFRSLVALAAPPLGWNLPHGQL